METPKLERDPEDGRPKPKKWTVTFTVQRSVEVDATNAREAEEAAREDVLFADEFPIDREEITDTDVGWVDPETLDAVPVMHLEGCWGYHCHHYGCDTSDTADSYRAYCSQCDIGAY